MGHFSVETSRLPGSALGGNQHLAPRLAAWTGAPTQLRIFSNLADRRLARARTRWLPRDVGVPEVVDAMLRAHAFADAVPTAPPPTTRAS